MKLFILTSVCVALFSVSCNCSKSSAVDNNTITTKEKNLSGLEGIWELNYLSGTKIAFEGLYPYRKPFLSFNTKEGRVSGNSSCNSFTGDIIVSGYHLHFDQSIAMTKMFCPGDGENNFINTLKKVDAYEISDEGGKLNLLAGGIVIMRLQKK